jgi:hypothetical protein
MITMFQWGLHPIYVKYTVTAGFYLFFLSLGKPTARTGIATWTNASIDADFLQEVPFGVSIFAKEFLGVIFASKKNEKLF